MGCDRPHHLSPCVRNRSLVLGSSGVDMTDYLNVLCAATIAVCPTAPAMAEQLPLAVDLEWSELGRKVTVRKLASGGSFVGTD